MRHFTTSQVYAMPASTLRWRIARILGVIVPPEEPGDFPEWWWPPGDLWEYLLNHWMTGHRPMRNTSPTTRASAATSTRPTRRSPEHLRKYPWYAAHQAWMKSVGWPDFDDPGDAASVRAVLRGADLRGADLRDADLRGADIPVATLRAAIAKARGTP